MASIMKRGNRYRALVRRSGTTRCKTFGSRREAEAWAASVERRAHEIAAHGYVAPKAATIAELIDAFEAAGMMRNGTTRSILRVSRRDVGHYRLSDFGFVQCLEWAERRMADGNEASTACVYVSTLGRVYKWGRVAKRLDLPASIFSEVRIHLRLSGHKTKPRTRDRIPTDAEVERIIGYFKSTWRKGKVPMHEIVRVAADTAMRRGEIVRVTVGDFDHNRRELTIRQRKHPVHKRDATIPILTNETLAILHSRCEGRSPNDLIFDFDGRSVGKQFTATMHELGLNGLVFHSLRHYCASRLIASGMTIPMVSIVTSHSDWAMLKRYTHLSAAQVHEQAQSLGIS
ncbi:hypothetical protein SuNHUV7_00550 (plasmid) [Pseudoseohaeicola sp. NH-UV-7]|uniref:tyrosine-type recombinase/integrase n=1 Tax=Sulfitobacter sp. TBRI5 TaxID=2989732 RepID=UPI003A6D1905